MPRDFQLMVTGCCVMWVGFAATVAGLRAAGLVLIYTGILVAGGAALWGCWHAMD